MRGGVEVNQAGLSERSGNPSSQQKKCPFPPPAEPGSRPSGEREAMASGQGAQAPSRAGPSTKDREVERAFASRMLRPLSSNNSRQDAGSSISSGKGQREYQHQEFPAIYTAQPAEEIDKVSRVGSSFAKGVKK